jgi:hypothetical protein
MIMSHASFLDKLSEELLSEAERIATVRAHIYGYRFSGKGEIEIVPDEAKVIEDVLSQIANIKFIKCSRLLAMIAYDYRNASPQVRNRSGQPFTPKKLAALCKSLYAGLQPNRIGLLVKVSNYPPIIDETTYKVAHARLRREGLLE